MQCGASPTLCLARTDDEQHLGAIECEQTHRRPRARTKPLESLNVAADLVGHLRARERGVAELEHVTRRVLRQCRNKKVAHMGRSAQVVDFGLRDLRCHASQSRTCSRFRKGQPAV